jgi:hypothetical protein
LTGNLGGDRAIEGDQATFVSSFPTLTENIHRRGKSKSYSFPIDVSQKRFESVISADSFRFEEIGRAAVKIKSIPLGFQWASNGDPEEQAVEAGGGDDINSSHPMIKGPTH